MRIINLKSEIINLFVWLFVSFVAIVVTASNPILGLLVAGAGGIVFGIFLFK